MQVFIVHFCFHDPIHAAGEAGDPLAYGRDVAAVRLSLLEALAWAGNHQTYREHREDAWWWFEVERWITTGDSLSQVEAHELVGIVDWNGRSLASRPDGGYSRKELARVSPLRARAKGGPK